MKIYNFLFLHFSVFRNVFGDGERARRGLPVRLSVRADITLSGSEVSRQRTAAGAGRAVHRTHNQRAGESVLVRVRGFTDGFIFVLF